MTNEERYAAWQRYIEYLKSLERKAWTTDPVEFQKSLDKEEVERFLASLNTSGN